MAGQSEMAQTLGRVDKLTLSDLERSKSRSFGFQSLISHKGTELGAMPIGNYMWGVQ